MDGFFCIGGFRVILKNSFKIKLSEVESQVLCTFPEQVGLEESVLLLNGHLQEVCLDALMK